MQYMNSVLRYASKHRPQRHLLKQKPWSVYSKTLMHQESDYNRMTGGSFRECLGGCAACGLLRKNFPQSSDLSRPERISWGSCLSRCQSARTELSRTYLWISDSISCCYRAVPQPSADDSNLCYPGITDFFSTILVTIQARSRVCHQWIRRCPRQSRLQFPGRSQ